MRALSQHTRTGVQALNRALYDIWERYRKLGRGGKALVLFTITVHVVITGIIVFFGPKKIFQTLYDTAQDIRRMRFGWLLLSSIAVVTSFPPLIGYSTTMTLCGFAYGPLGGFAIAAPSALMGSALTFVILRLLFKRRIKDWTQQKPRWLAMQQVVEAKGLPLIILIRLCPIPWVYSNALFASMGAVQLWQFVLATICLLPKLALVILIGSQVAKLSDGHTRGQMSTAAGLLDVFSIILSSGVAVATGWFVWAKTQEKIRHFQGGGVSRGPDEESALDDLSRPLLLHNLGSSESLTLDESETPILHPFNEHTRTSNGD